MPRSAMLHGITKDMRGIEIAPWYNPLTPKRDGFNCLVLDVFSKEELLKRAAADHNIIDENTSHIEHVDIVGSATEIENLVPDSKHGKFDYIVSSHNFEHLPNPIKFLQGCQKLLKPGGILSMAVPDKRACFDLFRPHTTVIDWLVAYRADRSRPSPEQIFQSSAYCSTLKQNQNDVGAFSIYTPLSGITVDGDLGASYRKWQASGETATYEDAHCSVMTPASFELLILECRQLGLLSLEIENVSEPERCEFYVRLVNSSVPRAMPDISAARTTLMRRMLEEGQIQRTKKMLLRKKKWTMRKRLSMNYIHAMLEEILETINSVLPGIQKAS
jgi:SAM-dependent methyltransferase